MLGAGNLDLCRARNSLLYKASKPDNSFTFPPELRAELQAVNLRKQLPDLMKMTFLDNPDHPRLNEDLFSSAHPGSEYFLANPRNFYALAANEFDAEGKTALAKWRLS
jgi:hypothetical protein